jgi:YggT family protein
MITFLINFVNILFEVLSLAIFVRIILSWFRVDPYNPFMQILYQITEPVLAPVPAYHPLLSA